jgi:hypothetical protein
MKDNILQNSIKIIRNVMSEDMGVSGLPTNNISSGSIEKFDPIMKLDGRKSVMKKLPKSYLNFLKKKEKG